MFFSGALFCRLPHQQQLKVDIHVSLNRVRLACSASWLVPGSLQPTWQQDEHTGSSTGTATLHNSADRLGQSVCLSVPVANGVMTVPAVVHCRREFVRLILKHSKETILCVCYTNHALDQFLEALLDKGIKGGGWLLCTYQLCHSHWRHWGPLPFNEINMRSRIKMDRQSQDAEVNKHTRQDQHACTCL